MQGGAFECACGAPSCRGMIAGWKHRVSMSPKTPSPEPESEPIKTPETAPVPRISRSYSRGHGRLTSREGYHGAVATRARASTRS